VTTPLIELNGASAGASADGLTLSGNQSSGSVIKGLIINLWSGDAISIVTNSASNVIVGNYLGTDPTGMMARAHLTCLEIQTDSNRIGGTTAAERNLLSGNTNECLVISMGAANNLVQGNYIGLDATGTAALGNGSNGIAIRSSGSSNTIGGTAAGTGNV